MWCFQRDILHVVSIVHRSVKSRLDRIWGEKNLPRNFSQHDRSESKETMVYQDLAQFLIKKKRVSVLHFGRQIKAFRTLKNAVSTRISIISLFSLLFQLRQTATCTLLCRQEISISFLFIVKKTFERKNQENTVGNFQKRVSYETYSLFIL